MSYYFSVLFLPCKIWQKRNLLQPFETGCSVTVRLSIFTFYISSFKHKTAITTKKSSLLLFPLIFFILINIFSDVLIPGNQIVDSQVSKLLLCLYYIIRLLQKYDQQKNRVKMYFSVLSCYHCYNFFVIITSSYLLLHLLPKGYWSIGNYYIDWEGNTHYWQF